MMSTNLGGEPEEREKPRKEFNKNKKIKRSRLRRPILQESSGRETGMRPLNLIIGRSLVIWRFKCRKRKEVSMRFAFYDHLEV